MSVFSSQTPDTSGLPCVSVDEMIRSLSLSVEKDWPPHRSSANWWPIVAPVVLFRYMNGIWFKTLTEGLPHIILLFKTYYQVTSVTFCVLLFYPAPWLPNPLPKMLPIYSTAVCLSRTTIWGSYLGFGQILPWFWTYYPSWYLTELALLIIWLQLLYLWVRGSSPSITRQLGAL